VSCGRRVRTQRDPHALIAALYAAARASTSSSSTHSPPRSNAYEPIATSRHEPRDCSNATGRSSTDSRSDPIRQPRRVLVPRRARHRHRRSNAHSSKPRGHASSSSSTSTTAPGQPANPTPTRPSTPCSVSPPATSTSHGLQRGWATESPSPTEGCVRLRTADDAPLDPFAVNCRLRGR